MDEFKNKVVAITGGSSGIGLAIAKKMEQAGAKVAILGRSSKKLGSIDRLLKVQGDVSKISDLDRFYQGIKSTFGTIDVLVGNAGIADPRALKDVDEAFFDEMVNINYKGLYFTVQRALPFLNDKASVILISSAAAHISWPQHSVYSSTKATVSYLAKSFSVELIKRGIRVNAISPGFVDTPMFDSTKKTSPETIEKIKDLIPVKRFAEAEEIAELAEFLASSKSSYIVGQDIVMDGGLSALLPNQT